MTRETQEELHLGFLPDRMHCLLIGQPQGLLGAKRTEHQPHELGGNTDRGVDLGCIGLRDLLPGEQHGQQHPAITRVEFSAKRQMELID